jgi:hypothetical protein
MSADSKLLRSFSVYFKDGTSVDLKAASFKAERRVEHTVKYSFDFHTENGETGAAYIDPQEVAAIIPHYAGEYQGQTFNITLKSAKTIEIRADKFTKAVDSFSFRNADGSHIEDVWVLISEVLACVPTIGLPSEFKYQKRA